MTPPETIGSTLGAVAAALAGARVDDARRRARRLVAAALDVSIAEILAERDRIVSEDHAQRVAELLGRTLAHEPLSRILGVREFWGLEFELSADTLDPRPETETIVEAINARLPNRSDPHCFLDLGTGSGCLLLALLSEFPAATGFGVDRVFGAAAAARRNADRLGLAARAGFAVGDWAAALNGHFDAVVANPPYIASADIAGLPREVRNFDPRIALDGGVDGLDAYRRIAVDLTRLLRPSGLFACEIGQGQNSEVAPLIAAHGLVIEEIVLDLAGIPRCVVARRSS
jgi:release factor glutamine methyltransferase